MTRQAGLVLTFEIPDHLPPETERRFQELGKRFSAMSTRNHDGDAHHFADVLTALESLAETINRADACAANES